MIPRSRVRSALRKLWLWSPERRSALKAAKVRRGAYRCVSCSTVTSEPEVDHVIPVGPTPGARGSGETTWDEFLKRLFCTAEGLQILCGPCHLAKRHKVEKAS